MTCWNITPAPQTGDEFTVPLDAGYDTCFWQDGWWWYYSRKNHQTYATYAVGPIPSKWKPVDNNEQEGQEQRAKDWAMIVPASLVLAPKQESKHIHIGRNY